MSRKDLITAGSLDPAKQIELLLPEIHDAVRLACLLFKLQVGKNDLEEYSQQVVILLMEDDYRRLRSFDQRSSLRTWLTIVVRHHLGRQLRKQKPTLNLEDAGADLLAYDPAQESAAISEEEMESLEKALKMLSERERLLLELLYTEEMSAAEAAEAMRIKVASVHRRKHEIIRKLQKLTGSCRKVSTNK